MKRRFVGIALLALALTIPIAVYCADSGKTEYGNSTLTLALGFSAKDLCSCYFVEKRGEKACREHVKIPQLSPKIRIDEKRARVTASYYAIFWQTARYEGERYGCVLE